MATPRLVTVVLMVRMLPQKLHPKKSNSDCEVRSVSRVGSVVMPPWHHDGLTCHGAAATTCFTSAMYRPAAAAASSALLPLWRASMYAAYQSHQSCGVDAFSNAS